MTEQTLKKANEIMTKINKLKEEIDWLDNRAGNGWRFRRIFGIKEVPIIKAAEKLHHREIFDLENDDVEVLKGRRIKLIYELQAEFESLQSCEESED